MYTIVFRLKFIFLQQYCKNVLRNSIIHKLLAGLMLFLFVFSIAPKKILHDLVADHKDTPTQLHHSTAKQLHPIAFNCNCDNLVVDLPFVYQNDIIQLITPLSYYSFSDNRIYNRCYQNNFDLELRGPPPPFVLI